MDVVSLIVGIGGTLLGAIVGVVGTLLSQRQQLAHQDRTRFHERRLETYSEFLAACDEVVRADRHMRVGDGETRAGHTFQTIKLIGTTTVVRAATDVFDRTFEVVYAPSDAERIPKYSKYAEAVISMTQAVRHEIGVQSALAQAPDQV
jgi:hypothetical protein